MKAAGCVGPVCLLLGLLLNACGGSSEKEPNPEWKVWAARMESPDQLLSGKTAKARPGDYKIWNTHVAFTIHDVGLAPGYKRYGGQLADADAFDAQGNPLGASQLGELFFGFNQRLFEPSAVELVSPTDNEGRALVRVLGQDAFFEWLGAYLANVLPMGTIDSDLTFEYSLGPDDRALRIEVSVRNRGNETLILDMGELVTINGDGLQPYFEGPGFRMKDHAGEFRHWVARGDSLSYGLVAEDGPVSMFLNLSNIAFGVFPRESIRPGRSHTFVRWLVVAQGGVNGVQQELWALEGREDLGSLIGVVNADSAALEAGVRVHAVDSDERHRGSTRVLPDGSFELSLPAGDYLLTAKADGRDASEFLPVEVKIGQQVELSLDLPPATRVGYRITDGDGSLSPARLTFLRQDDVSTNILDAAYGEEYWGHAGAARVVWEGTGEGEVWLPDGTYEFVVSRGYNYEYERIPLVLTGQDEQVEAQVIKVVDTSGYLAGDFHIHGQFSPDSSVDPDLRVRSAMSEGVDLLVMTEHDFIKDFGAAVEAIPGASDRVKAIIGSEITTYMYGHFNAWPLTEKTDQLNNGAVEWFNTPAPALFERIRQSEDHQLVIQVNHPRSAAIGGYFEALGLNVANGTYERDDWWSPNFDSIEVFNGGCSNGNKQELQDWFGFINRGYRVALGGGSDSHYQYHNLGTPRVYVPTQAGPADFDPFELVPAFTGQRVMVSCGPFVRFSIEGKGLGDLVSSNGPITASIEVQAPSWMDLDELRILNNAQVAWSLPVEDWTPGQGAVRHTGTVELLPDADAWFALEVTGRSSTPPVSYQVPYALTNPIYLDFDGNGQFDAPLPPYRLVD